jgi:hypothetical protein
MTAIISTEYEKALAAKLAEELITTIKAKVAPRAVLLEDRIAKATAYLDAIDSPNGNAIKHVLRHLDGDYDDMPFENPAATMRDLFTRRWVCRVVSTGYNNGAGCDPSDPHGPAWRCGYFWQASLTDKQAKEYGLVTVEEAEGSAT